jgi:hypothetical protein
MSDNCPRCGSLPRRHHVGFHCGTEVADDGAVIQSDGCRSTAQRRAIPQTVEALREVLRVKQVPAELKKCIEALIGELS